MKIKRKHTEHNDTGIIETNTHCGLSLLDSLQEVAWAAERAYQEAVKRFSTGDDELPELRYDGDRWRNAATGRLIPLKRKAA
jgi:hypothetical protein